MAEATATPPAVDETLANPDNLTKYKTAAEISQKVLAAVSGWCVEGAKVLDICIRGDKLLDEEIGKVFKGKKINKGISHPATVSPSTHVTPYTPLVSEKAEAETTLQKDEVVKIQLGAQIDGYGTIVCNNIVVGATPEQKITGRTADLLLATYYANELLLRLMVPPGLVPFGSEEEQKKTAAGKPPTQSEIISLVEKVARSYDVQVVENTTSWLFARNEIEGNKRIILSPGSTGGKGEGSAEVLDVWGVEMGMSLGSGKVKDFPLRTTLHRRTTTTYQLKRPSSRQTLNEVVEKFGNYPFSLRQLDDEKASKVGVVECVRGGVFRAYEPAGEADGSPVSRLLTTIAITKNGLIRLAAPPQPDLSKFETDKKIEDEEILKILEQPLAKATANKNKNKNKNKKSNKDKTSTPASEQPAQQ